MKLCTFTHDGKTRTGIVVGDKVVETGVTGTMIDLIRDWEALKPGLEAKAAIGEGAIPLAEVKLEAPVPRPGKIFAIGLNYADHIAESGLGTPERQVWFTKAQTSVNAPYDPILIARGTVTPDYEAELVAVIGTGGKHIAAPDAPAAIFGYCVGNDVTERMWQHAVPQWS
jgi:2-keto-4-pentenoate hydratase/2-oxohepta-3-ene-1,7-dioic acid hydratase in catechol pathway